MADPFSWTTFFIWVALTAASKIVSYLVRPKIKTGEGAKPATFDKNDFPMAKEGEPIPVVFGRRWVKGLNVVWYGDIRSEAVKRSAGGGGGGKK